jgi:hypothetical protein
MALNAPDKLLTPAEVSAELTQRGIGRTVSTLAKLRIVGGGPPFKRFGRDIRYPASSLEAWITDKLSVSVETLCQLDNMAMDGGQR